MVVLLRATIPSTALGHAAKSGSRSVILEGSRPDADLDVGQPLAKRAARPLLPPSLANNTVRHVEMGIRAFGIARLDPDESSAGSTPSHVYTPEADFARVAPPTPGRDTIREFFFVCVTTFLCRVLGG